MAVLIFENTPCRFYLKALVALCSLTFLFACSSVPAPPKISPPPREFSDALARAHLEGLAGIGPRLPGDGSDVAAREYLEREFQAIGGLTRSIDVDHRQHMLVEIPGESEDSLLLVTPLQALGSLEWVDDSGPAVFLELVRVLAAERPAYTLRFVLVATSPRSVASGKNPEWRVPEDPSEARELIYEAGSSLVAEMQRLGELDRVRAVIALEIRARPQPRMARDLRSHPVFRTVFWSAAKDLDVTDVFPSDASWSSPRGLQAAFEGGGLSQVVALVDETTARAELLSERANQRRADEASRERRPKAAPVQTEGLDPVGRVTLEALARLMRRFQKVDAFSH